jgi:hypothetical protein
MEGRVHQGRDREGSPHIFNINHFVIKTSSDMGCIDRGERRAALLNMKMKVPFLS